MKIYFISLEQDAQRRLKLAQRFPINFKKMQWIQAINGKELSAKEYFFHTQQYFNIHKKMITPSEVGCTLSHIKALTDFLSVEDEYALILEDDVIGCDIDIEEIRKKISEIDLNGVMLCGGQIDMGMNRYILGKEIKGGYCLANFSKRFVFGTCCYVIDKRSALHIINKHSQSILKADEWDNLLGEEFDMYLYDIIKHPDNFFESHIQNERDFFNETSFFKRVFKQGFFWKIFNRLRNDFFYMVLIAKNYRRVKSKKRKYLD